MAGPGMAAAAGKTATIQRFVGSAADVTCACASASASRAGVVGVILHNARLRSVGKSSRVGRARKDQVRSFKISAAAIIPESRREEVVRIRKPGMKRGMVITAAGYVRVVGDHLRGKPIGCLGRVGGGRVLSVGIASAEDGARQNQHDCRGPFHIENQSYPQVAVDYNRRSAL